MTKPTDNSQITVHTNTLLSLIKRALSKKELNSLESLFLAHITKPESIKNLNDFRESIEYLSRSQIGLSGQAKILALFLIDYLIEHNYYKEALELLKNAARFLPPDRVLRRKICQLYKNVYSDYKNIDVLIRLSNIEESAPLERAMAIIDKLISLDIGNPVYSSRYGYGVVSKFDFTLDTLSIDFFNSQTQTFTFDQALKSLQAMPKDNIYYLKEKYPSLLIRLMTENPAELVKIIKRDLPETTKNSDIKHTLNGVVLPEVIDRFIEYIKKSQTQSKPKIKKPAENNALVDNTLISSYSQDKITELVNSIPAISKPKFVITLKDCRSDWLELYLNLFFTQSEKRLLQTLFSELDNLKQRYIIDKTFAEYKRYPSQFLFLAEILNEDPYAILTRYLDLMQLSLVTRKRVPGEKSSLASEIRKQLIKDNYELIRKTVIEITSDIAKRIFARVQDIKNLYPEERDAIINIIKQQFPELSENNEEYIYSTGAAIKNKEAELHKLVSEEIPKAAADIARARGYGDLRENFEYKVAKEKQKRLLHKTSEMRHELAKAKPIDFTKIDSSKVTIGTTVKFVAIHPALPLKQTDKLGLHNVRKGGIHDTTQIFSYTILGPWDSDVGSGIISYLAPFAKTMLNKVPGDQVIDSEGKIYKIAEIHPALPLKQTNKQD